jgi:large subunit ribosomal protein L35
MAATATIPTARAPEISSGALAFGGLFPIERALFRAARLGMPWPTHESYRALWAPEESEMPKMKTKSGAKKRFKFTASGKVKKGQVGERHGMIKRTNEQIRNLRGTSIASASETQRVKRWMPYG